MAINEVYGLTLDLSANTDKFVKDLQKAAKDTDLELGFDTEPLIKRFGDAQKELKGVFAKTVADAATLGMSRTSIEGLSKKLSPLTDQIESSMKRVFDLKIEAHKKGLDDITKKEKLATLANEQQKLRSLQFRHDWEKKATDRLLDRRKKAVQDAEQLAARTRGEAAEEFGKGISEAFSNLKSGNVGGVLKGAGKGMATRGAGMEMKGAAMGGGMGKLVGMLGKFMSAVGPALMAIGGIAAGIGAIIGIALAADGAMKELNRTLFDSGVAASELTDGYGSMGATLDRVRSGFTGAFLFNKLWGTTAKDHLAIFGAYSKAGLTFREITAGVADAAEEMERLKDATETALVYSKLLGTTSTEMAETFATRMEEMGQTIDGVQESLSAVHMAARESGFGVKRFFNMVLQATSGMSMYNVRMEEAAGLLLRLGGILGSKMGGDFLANLTKGFVDESTQDKYKRVMTTGSGRTKATFGRTAGSTARAFVKKLDEKKLGTAFAAAAERAKLTVDFKDSKQLVKDLGALSKSDQTTLLAEARLSGDDAMVTQLTNLMMATQGAKGGRGNMAMSLGGLDMGGKLMMQLQQGMALGLGPIHEMGLRQTMAFESITGVSGEQLELLKRVSQGLTGNHQTLQRMANDTKLYEGKSILEQMKMKEAQVKAYGAYVEGGKVFAAKLDENGAVDKANAHELTGKLGEYLQSQGEVLTKAAKEGVPADIQLAQEMVAQTTGLATILEQGVEFWLERVYYVVQSILNVFSTSTEKQAKAEALYDLKGRMGEKRTEARALGKQIASAQAEVTATKGKDREAAQAKLAGLQLDLDTVNRALAVTDSQRSNLLEDPAQVKYFWEEGEARSKTKMLHDAIPGGGGAFVESTYGQSVEQLAPKIMAPLMAELREREMAGLDQKAVEEMMAKRRRSRGYTSRSGEIREGRNTVGEVLEADRMKKGNFETAKSESPRMLAEYEATRRELLAKMEARMGVYERALESQSGTLTERALLELPFDTEFTDKVSRAGAWFSSEGRKGLSGHVVDKATGKPTGERTPFTKDMASTLENVLAATDTTPVVRKLQEAALRDRKAQRDSPTGREPRAFGEAAATAAAAERRKEEQSRVATELANIFEQAGGGPGSRKIEAMAKGLVGGGGLLPKSPWSKTQLNKVITPADEVAGTAEVTFRDLLIEKGILAKPKANDWVGGEANGKMWAQRIDHADQVTVAAEKATGGVAQARKGGSTVVINSFGAAAEVIRGIQVAVAAKVV